MTKVMLPSSSPNVLLLNKPGKLMGLEALRSSLTHACAVGIVFSLGPVWAESDSLISAVEFALTGTNHVEPQVIGNVSNCVFVIKNELFRLDNVYTDRIKIQRWQDRRFGKLEQGVTVELHGSETVFEITTDSPKDDSSELTKHMRAESPEMFSPHHYTYTHYRLHLPTNDEEGVKRAWQRIYTDGCSGKRSP
jgi:hypothetical protein